MNQAPFVYNSYGSWIRSQFPFRVQKISIDAGFSCPNRDGKLSYGGCTFCDNSTFNPQYCNREKTISQQLSAGKSFFKGKYPSMRYLAYFQSYSNTYAPLDVLKLRYEEALADPDVVGIVIGTRPDCVDESLLDYLQTLSRQTFVVIEYGIESVNNSTLRTINRGHDFECSERAILQTCERGILCGAHLILGLPGEGREEILHQARVVSSLPINILKLHQLQIIRGTRLAQQYTERKFHVFSVEEYADLLVEYIQLLPPSIVLDRFVSQSPRGMCIAPNWRIKNHEFTDLLTNKMKSLGAYQGKALVQDNVK